MTSSTGEYQFPDVRVGVYDVDATATGFSKAEADRVTVSVGVRQRIDLRLKIGGTETVVEVTGVELQLETESSERDQTITNYQSEGLALVSRNCSDLLGLVTGSRQAPTAVTTTSINSLVRAGAYNINGERSVFNNFLLDGSTTIPTASQTRASTTRSLPSRPLLLRSFRSSPITGLPSTAALPAQRSMSPAVAAPIISTPQHMSSSATPT